MRLPTIQGIIRRRILVNYRVDPGVIQRQLPAPFQPKLHDNSAIAGICLIRLEDMRLRGIPDGFGIGSENAAHRVAVTWTDEYGIQQEGVYIPRRDTNSRITYTLGSRLFPGQYHPADFDIRDTEGSIDLTMRSRDNQTTVTLHAQENLTMPESSSFRSLAEASSFFEDGAVGYSDVHGDRLDGMRLETTAWNVEPLSIDDVYSSYFADEQRFPPGSVTFDCALIMRDVPHVWHALPSISGTNTDRGQPPS